MAEEANQIKNTLEPECRKEVRWITEGHCLQLVAAKATKASGVKMICEWLKIPLPEIAAIGDTGEDKEMMELHLDTQAGICYYKPVTKNNN